MGAVGHIVPGGSHDDAPAVGVAGLDNHLAFQAIQGVETIGIVEPQISSGGVQILRGLHHAVALLIEIAVCGSILQLEAVILAVVDVGQGDAELLGRRRGSGVMIQNVVLDLIGRGREPMGNAFGVIDAGSEEHIV